MSAPNDTAKGIIRAAIDEAFKDEVCTEFAARCDNIAMERQGQGDAILIAIEVRDEFYSRYGITQNPPKGE